MSTISSAGNDGYVDFIELFKLADLERALIAYQGTPEYEAVLRYYFGCIALHASPELREPLALLRQALATISTTTARKRRSPELGPGNGLAANPALTLEASQAKLDHFNERFNFGREQLAISAIEVPKKQHFVWLGGGIGDIQRDYINVWKHVLANQGYGVQLWYDSDALLAHETNRIIVAAAKADSMTSGGAELSEGHQLADLYVARARVLKHQMFAHLQLAQQNGQSADQARIDLLVRGYGQDRATLEALRAKNLGSFSSLVDDQLVLRDIQDEPAARPLQDIYQREIGLRGNLAAASDIVRFQALDREGGAYSDVDVLPPLADTLGDVMTRSLGADAQHGALQLILDHNPHWMPGRQALREKYQSYFERIPQEHRQALERFAKSQPALTDVFVAPPERLVHPDGLCAFGIRESLSNAFLLAHPGAAMLGAVMQRFRFNFEVFDAVALEASKQGIGWDDGQRIYDIAEDVIQGRIGRFSELPDDEELRAKFLAEAIANYFSDGIRPGEEATIYMTGPAAMREGMSVYERTHFTPAHAEQWRKQAALIEGFNTMTEEENDHSWKENAPLDQWLQAEQTQWRDGTFTTRYSGDLAQLLKEPTIDFDEGWPVIEGRPVLLTSILQRLADELGEGFLNAMAQSHTGPVRFEKALALSFEDRQAIIGQARDALPPESFSGPSTVDLSLDEVLARIAEGRLFLAQLSPQQRLLLGALLGVTTLDQDAFTARASALDNLANRVREGGVSNRYAAIERELYKHNSALFVAGRSDPPESSLAYEKTSLAAKKDALAKPLTLRQWGQAAARIEHLAKLEYRDRIFQKMDIVVGSFDSATARLSPQDLLLQGPGDRVAGRCYPLVLVMAASIEKGPTAVGTLRERFYLGVLEPGEQDSKLFLQALEELRGAEINDIGSPLARAGLEQVVATLKARTASCTLMLNSDNHSMLVAKTVEAQGSAYHFYDPNFGTFEFADPQLLTQALTRFLLHYKMAEHYAAYGEPDHPMFDLIEVDGKRVSQLPLSSSGRVADLLQPGALPGEITRPRRQRLASIRGQSLESHPHLGSSLLALDSHWWGQQIGQSMTQLRQVQGLAPEWMPLFKTVEATPAGDYQISLINLKDPEQLLRVSTDDPRLLRISNYLSETFSSLATKRAAPNGVDPAEASSVHTLNAGFTIQALMQSLRAQEGEDKSLTMAVRLHAYVNYAQLLHGNVVDVLGVITLVKQALADVEVIARTSASVVGAALGHVANEGVGAVLGLANVGFDIYQLATASSEIERAQFGTQLAFDSASVLVTGAGIGAGLLGAGSAAAVLGGAGVLLGGLAIGVAALAQGFATIAEEAKQVGEFFDGLEKAYRAGGYRLDGASNTWIPEPATVFKRVDLRAGRLMFASPMLLALRDHFGVPDVDPDHGKASNIRQVLRLPGSAAFTAQSDQVIVLPGTPQTYYGYAYKALPFARLRHDVGFDTARRLETKDKDGRWRFLFTFYSFPAEYICYRLYPACVQTQIDVVLDAVERTLVVPALPTAWHSTLTYRIEGGGAPCTLLLNPGVRLELEAPSPHSMSWLLLATWASPGDVRLTDEGELVVGTTVVTFHGRRTHRVVIKLANNQVFEVDRGRSRFSLIEQDAPAGMSEQALQEHLKRLAQAHRLALPYTPVHRYLIPFEKREEPRYTTAYYEAAENRLLYIRNPSTWWASHDKFGGVVDGYGYFYRPDSNTIWQVDANTGWIYQAYNLLHQPTQRSTIVRCEATSDGAVQVVQRLARDDGAHDELAYLIHDGRVFLCSVTRGREPGLEAVLGGRRVTLVKWPSVLGNYEVYPDRTIDAGIKVVEWQLAALVSICWEVDVQRRDMTWVRSSDRLIIRPVARNPNARGWPEVIKDMRTLMLIAPQGTEGDVFLVYDKLQNGLCRMRKPSAPAGGEWVVDCLWMEAQDGLDDVVAVQDSYLVRTDTQLFFNITREGELQLGGLTDLWFKDRAQWWSELAPLAARYPVDNFALLGLTNFKGDARLCAWYMDRRLLLADLGHGKEVRLLGLTPDRQSAWLFDVSSGELYRQAFIDPERLGLAFAQGTRLLQADALPAPVREWNPWRFADVVVQEDGLQATTADGVVVELRDQLPARVSAVESPWVLAHRETLRESLKALVQSHGHRVFVQVFDAQYVSWYVVASERFIRIPKLGTPEHFTLLGTQQRTHVLLHDDHDGFLRTYPGAGQLGPLSFVQRTEEVMVIEGRQKVGDLIPMIPDGVSTLVLCMGQGEVTYQLTAVGWFRLETVIVDCRHPLGHAPIIPGKLIWSLDAPQNLLLSIVEHHLVIIDPNTDHSMVFREVFSADASVRGEVYLAIQGYRPFLLSRLIDVLLEQPGSAEGVMLQTLVPLLGIGGGMADH